MRAAIYVRCSTTSKRKFGDTSAYLQNPEAQVEPLVNLLASRGWELYQVYSDRMSGAKESRPGLQALTADARRGLFGVVVVWRFDRFARSVKQLVMALEEFHLAERRRHPGFGTFAAQYPACMYPCQRFDGSLATGHA
jgi:site-specific DNA recombinase